MSHVYYDTKWQQAVEELAELVNIENPPPEDPSAAPVRGVPMLVFVTFLHLPSRASHPRFPLFCSRHRASSRPRRHSGTFAFCMSSMCKCFASSRTRTTRSCSHRSAPTSSSTSNRYFSLRCPRDSLALLFFLFVIFASLILACLESAIPPPGHGAHRAAQARDYAIQPALQIRFHSIRRSAR